MDIRVDVKGIDSIEALLADLQRSIEPIVARAINDTAFRNILPDVKAEMRRVFQKPTPFVLRAFRVTEKAAPGRLQARLGYVDVFRSKRIRADTGDTLNLAEAVVAPHILGGGRVAKDSELRLRSAGILDANEYLVPGPAARLDTYGNPRRGEWQKLTSFFRAHREGGYNANRRAGAKRSRRGTRYIIQNYGNARGIVDVSTRGRSGLVWLIVRRQPRYKPILDIEKVARQSFDANYPAHFDRYLARRR